MSDCDSNDERALIKYEDELERTSNDQLINQQDLYTQKLFLAFQNAATNVTKMFRERSTGTNNWNTFQAAAESVTMLYKESLDTLKDAIQLGIIHGEQRKTNEILRWTHRKPRRHIRTDEVYDYLMDRPSTRLTSPSEPGNPTDIVDDLQTFRQALVMNENPNHSEQLENFVRQQVDNQLARKRNYYATDSSTMDCQKSKRARHT